MIVVTDMLMSDSGNYARFRLKLAGAYLTGSEYVSWIQKTGSNASAWSAEAYAVGAPQTSVRFFLHGNNGVDSRISFTMHVNNPANGPAKRVEWLGSAIDTGGNIQLLQGIAYPKNTKGALTGVRFYGSTGTIASGTFRLYGIVNS